MADKVIEARVIQKIATEVEWMLVDRVLYKGEIALVSNGSRVNNIKVGDGSNYFSELPYIYKGGFSGSVDRSTDGSTVLDGFYIAKEPGVYYSLGNLLVRENTFTILQKELGVWSIASETPLPTLDDYINPTQFALIDAFFTPNYLGDYNKIKWNSFKINHFAIESNMREWNILGGEFTTPTTNAYCIYLKCNKSNNDGEVYITTAQIDAIQTDYYYFLIGVINSYQPSLGAREVSMLQGFSMMSGSFVKTGRISSNDGSTYFDLDSGEFKGKFTFTNGESVEEAITNQEIYIEYSQNGIDWHTTFLYDDVFMRQKKGDGAWSNAIRIVGIQGIKGDNGADGQTQYVHIRYSANSDGSSMTTTPQANTAYIGIVTTTSSVAPTSNTSYTWAKFKGENGVPGIPGADGSSLFTWVKYATDANGSNMSDFPDGKTHIGLAYNKTTSIESNTASDYTWALIKGEQGNQGVPGVKGADGQQFYTWIKYATTPTSGMSDDPTGKLYMGIAYNKTIQTESSNYADYSWSLIKGEQGTQGVPGIPGADGSSLFTWVKYADTPTSGMSDYPDDKLYIGLAYNKVTATESNNYEDYSWSLMPQNIEIGGRNLAAFSKATAYENRISEYEDIPVNKTGKSKYLNVTGYNNFLRFHGLSSLGEYTFSTWIKRINTDSADIISFQVGDVEIAKVPIDGTWKYVKYTFNVTDVTELYNFIQLKSLSKYISYAIFEPKLEKGNKATDWTPAPEDVETSILQSKTDSINASKAYSDAQDELKRIQTEAYADGKVTAAEQRAINDATAKAEAAKLYATAQDNLLRTQLEAYADGQITAEEQQRIQQMQDNLVAAKAYADAQANLAKIAANAYADGVVDEEEARAIADATAKMEAAKQHAQSLVNNIQIGGRNLLLNSTFINGVNNWSIDPNFNYGLDTNSILLRLNGATSNLGIYQIVNVEPNSDYVLTFETKATYQDFVYIKIGFEGYDFKTIDIDTSPYKWSKKTIFLRSGSSTSSPLAIKGIDGVGVNNFFIRNIKLEKGNKATDWTPAPEDVDNAINDVKTKAENALTQLTSIANDNILSPSEKQQVSNEWNRIKSEYTSNYSLGVSNGVSTTNLTNAYNDLFNYINPLLVDISVESSIVGDVFRAKFKAYYDQNIALIVAINDKLRSGISANTGAINQLNSTLERINKVTSFLGTTVDNNVIATGVVLVGQGANGTGGLSGIRDNNDDSIFLFAGADFNNRYRARWTMSHGGFERGYHSNGILAFERGYDGSKWIFNMYNESGAPLFQLDSVRGLVPVNYTSESWSRVTLLKSNIATRDYNTVQSSLKSFIESNVSVSSVKHNPDEYFNYMYWVYSYSYNNIYVCWDYYNGTHPNNAQYANYVGYKVTSDSRTNNITDGWYFRAVEGVFTTRDSPNGSQTFELYATVYYIQNGKIIETQNLNYIK